MNEQKHFEIYQNSQDWETLKAVVQAQMSDSFIRGEGGYYKDVNDEMVSDVADYYDEYTGNLLSNTGHH